MKTTYYDWVSFIRSIVKSICLIAKDPDRDLKLQNMADQVFEKHHSILNYDVIDPLSFIYAFAQRNTTHQRRQIFDKAKSVLNISDPIPTDYNFPTPVPNALSLFHDDGCYVDRNGNTIGNDCLWEFFNDVATGENLSQQLFQKVLQLKNVGFVKVSQVMFLINPAKYIPFDTQMNSLPGDGLENLAHLLPEIQKHGIPVYLKIIDQLKQAFPGCELYEINLLNVFTRTPDKNYLKLTDKYCQVSSWAEGQNINDYFLDFEEQNAVWTGGPSSSSGNTKYPLTDFDRGDIVLVRRGTKKLGGIGVIIRNDYIPNGYSEEDSIKIIWLAKEERWLQDDALGQWIGFQRASTKTIEKFREMYPSTFSFINKIRNIQRSEMNHSQEKRKNIILHGPPGTGKTRLAKQIAQWLTSDEEKKMSLMEAIEQEIFTVDPETEDNPQVKLIQFHPSYNYEDFVRGIKAETKDGGGISYVVENRVLAAIAEEASKPENARKAYVLLIDEINRANLTSVLGELIYALEYRGRAVSGLYKRGDSDDIMLPNNLYVIGTMNTADRSVSHLDYAIRRRFSFVQVRGKVSAIPNAKGRALYSAILDIFEKYTSNEFRKTDITIGHSYFLCDENELTSVLKYDVIPLLDEYVNDGILGSDAQNAIDGLRKWN